MKDQDSRPAEKTNPDANTPVDSADGSPPPGGAPHPLVT
jgi:hypothetical protein